MSSTCNVGPPTSLRASIRRVVHSPAAELSPQSRWQGWISGHRRERRLGPEIFACGASRRLQTVTDLWRRRINRVFDEAGSFERGRPTPHVFRHTFVRLLLQRGVPPRDVAELIGDTEGVVLKHYPRWVPERRERLTNILREKLATAPRGTLQIVRRIAP